MRPSPIDERTIALLRDTAHDGDPRTYLAECAGCGRPFWVLVGRAGRRAYCDNRCRQRAHDARRRSLPDQEVLA